MTSDGHRRWLRPVTAFCGRLSYGDEQLNVWSQIYFWSVRVCRRAGIWMVNRKSWASMRHWRCDCVEEQGHCITPAAVKHCRARALSFWGATHKASEATSTLSARQAATSTRWTSTEYQTCTFSWNNNIGLLQCKLPEGIPAVISSSPGWKNICRNLVNPPWTQCVG